MRRVARNRKKGDSRFPAGGRPAGRLPSRAVSGRLRAEFQEFSGGRRVPRRRIVIAGGGTAGWLTACYLAKVLGSKSPLGPEIVVIESPDIGIIGVGEGTFPTIRTTLMALGIDEARFLRESSATFKQGVRFDDWSTARVGGRGSHYFQDRKSVV